MIVADFEYDTDENPPRRTDKIILVVYMPVNASAFKKAPIAASKNALKSKFVGIAKDFQANDWSEMDHETIRKEMCKK